ncbi:MAG: TonB-dependent receptor [Bacteroidia bacterium]
MAQDPKSSAGIIKGKVTSSGNNEPLPFAVIFVQGTNLGATTDLDGNYIINNVPGGTYNVQATLTGYKKNVVYEVMVNSVRPSEVNFVMETEGKVADTMVIRANPFIKTAESPISVRTIGVAEIERNPGGNRDISKAIQTLPGVASSVSFRNDIIIRGGAPNENRFFLDGVEVPNINHFATQGSSGGPVGMINVNFIREVDFYSGAFPSTRGNALSSVFEFKMKDGNPDRLVTSATVGASDFGLTFDGPIGKNTTFIFSARRSYLQFLFKALELPFLPIYNDFQFKTKTKIGDKGELTVLGLGAIDQFELNKDANETETQQYLLNVLPVNNQWNYTMGATYRHFLPKGSLLFVLSRNMLNNSTVKYFNNDESSPANLLQDYLSQESENKFRFEHYIYDKGWKFTYGAGAELVRYTNSTYQKVVIPAGVQTVDFSSLLYFMKYGAFGQVSRSFADSRLTLSLGLRTDFSDYSSQMSNPLQQLSPRFSASYAVTEKISVNFNTGRYYQLPAYTVLGFRDSLNNLVNRNNGVKYISVDHIVGGVEWLPWENARITVEGFYKKYSNYPFLIADSISLANLGADFGVIGNDAITSTSSGRSYGLEFLIQQKLYKGFYGILAYTMVRSEFKTKNDTYAPSAWDNGHIVSLTAGKKFKKGWELGFRWRFQGGTPYTPYNVALSSLKSVWDVAGRGIPDYSLLNTLRFQPIHQLDMRVDKKWYVKKFSLNLYFDVQNVYNSQLELQPYLTVVKDANGNPVTDPNNPNAYQIKYIENTSGTVLPTIGIIFEF